MNIGIVTTWFPAGAGYVSKAYRQKLTEKHKVFIFARQGRKMKGDSVWDDNKVYWAKNHHNSIDLKDFKKWIKRNKIDLIFFNEQRYWKPVVVAKKMGVCIGAYIDYYKEDTIKAFSIYDFLICNTKRHFSAFNWHPNSYYIPWGTDIDKFKPKTEKQKNKNIKFLFSLGWGASGKTDRRGFSLALSAFTNIKSDCQLLVYSQRNFSDCLPEWKNIIKNDIRIKFIEGTFDPFPFQEGDVYVYPSKLDGIGLSLPEALSCGLPAITTNNPPMNEFVIHGKNGQLVDVETHHSRSDGYYWPLSICSIASLTKAFQTYIDNPNLVEIQGNKAREYAVYRLNWKDNSENLNNIFENNMNLFNKQDITQELLKYTYNLDAKYYPSLKYRFLILCRDIIFHFTKAVKFFIYINR